MFTLGDHFFADVLGPSFPGHAFMLAAQAGWATSNPDPSQYPYCGCDESLSDTIDILDNQTCTIKKVFPCFNIPSVPDVQPAGVDWQFYGSDFYKQVQTNEIWSLFDAVDSIRHGPGWSHVVNTSQFKTNVENHTLPNVTWLVPEDFNCEARCYLCADFAPMAGRAALRGRGMDQCRSGTYCSTARP